MKLPPHAGPGSAPDAIQRDISLTGGVFIKRLTIPKAGTLVPQHSHTYDHTSLLVRGAMRVWADDVDLGEFTAPGTAIPIRALVQHQMLTLADDTTFCCIHSITEADAAGPDVHEEGRLPEPDPLPEPDAAGFVVAVEEWADFLANGGPALMAEHAAAVGADHDVDVEAVAEMDAVGGVHLVTARSNGRAFGYLATQVGRSLERRGVLIASTTAFYAAPSARGMGAKMLRETIRDLRRRGVHEVVMRAGVRGDGPRLGALYRRLGAEPLGEMFRLVLKEP